MDPDDRPWIIPSVALTIRPTDLRRLAKSLPDAERKQLVELCEWFIEDEKWREEIREPDVHMCVQQHIPPHLMPRINANMEKMTYTRWENRYGSSAIKFLPIGATKWVSLEITEITRLAGAGRATGFGDEDEWIWDGNGELTYQDCKVTNFHVRSRHGVNNNPRREKSVHDEATNASTEGGSDSQY